MHVLFVCVCVRVCVYTQTLDLQGSKAEAILFVTAKTHTEHKTDKKCSIHMCIYIYVHTHSSSRLTPRRAKRCRPQGRSGPKMLLKASELEVCGSFSVSIWALYFNGFIRVWDLGLKVSGLRFRVVGRIDRVEVYRLRVKGFWVVGFGLGVVYFRL